MSRNIKNVPCTNVVINKIVNNKMTFLDYGGGYGAFTRMMRDIGYDFKWQDKYSPNLFARGFEYQQKEQINLIAAFELFEHFSKPKKKLNYLFSISDNILFLTLLYDKGIKYKLFLSW